MFPEGDARRLPFLGGIGRKLLQRLTVRSVKFIRWLPVQLFLQPHHEPPSAALRQLYTVL